MKLNIEPVSLLQSGGSALDNSLDNSIQATNHHAFDDAF